MSLPAVRLLSCPHSQSDEGDAFKVRSFHTLGACFPVLSGKKKGNVLPVISKVLLLWPLSSSPPAFILVISLLAFLLFFQLWTFAFPQIQTGLRCFLSFMLLVKWHRIREAFLGHCIKNRNPASPGGRICPYRTLFSPRCLSTPDLLCILGLAVLFSTTSPVPRAEPQRKTFLNEGVNYPLNWSQLPTKESLSQSLWHYSW